MDYPFDADAHSPLPSTAGIRASISQQRYASATSGGSTSFQRSTPFRFASLPRGSTAVDDIDFSSPMMTDTINNNSSSSSTSTTHTQPRYFVPPLRSSSYSDPMDALDKDVLFGGGADTTKQRGGRRVEAFFESALKQPLPSSSSPSASAQRAIVSAPEEIIFDDPDVEVGRRTTTTATNRPTTAAVAASHGEDPRFSEARTSTPPPPSSTGKPNYKGSSTMSYLEADDMLFARGGGGAGSAINFMENQFQTPSRFAAPVSFERMTNNTTTPARAHDLSSTTFSTASTANVYATPQTAAPPQHRTAATAPPPLTPSTAPSHVRELAQKYFTILRQVQQQDSPPPHPQQQQQQQQHTSAGDPLTKQHQHPQHHLISRSFELQGDMDDGSCFLHRLSLAESSMTTNRTSDDVNDESGSAVHEVSPLSSNDEVRPTTTSSCGEEDNAVVHHHHVRFNCSPEVSLMVNMGDVALCRLIDIRAQWAMEQEGFLQFCRATAAVSDMLPDRLSIQSQALQFSDGRRAQTERQNEDEEETPSSPSEDQEQIRSVLSHINGFSSCKAVLEELAARLSSFPAGGELSAATTTESSEGALGGTKKGAIMRALIEELHATEKTTIVGGGQNVFQLDQLLNEVSMLQRQEEEARLAGNLSHGASSRREILHKLHEGLQLCLKDVSRLAHEGPTEEVSLAQRVTDRLIEEWNKTAKREAMDAQRQVNHAKDVYESAVVEVQTAVQKKASIVMEHEQFLMTNEAEMHRVLEKLEALYGTLEGLVNHRSTKMKEFMCATGSNCIARQKLEAVASEAKKQLADLEARGSVVDRSLQHLQLVQQAADAVTKFRSGLAMQTTSSPPPQPQPAASTNALEGEDLATCNSNNATPPPPPLSAAEVKKSMQQSLQQSATQIAHLLRHGVSQWSEVMLRNQQREVERSVVLHSQIRDAMDRYHQQDVDLFKTQLEECLQRKKAIDSELEELEKMVRSDERQAAKLIPNFLQEFSTVPSSASAGATSVFNTSVSVGGGSRPTSSSSAAHPHHQMHPHHIRVGSGEMNNESFVMGQQQQRRGMPSVGVGTPSAAGVVHHQTPVKQQLPQQQSLYQHSAARSHHASPCVGSPLYEFDQSPQPVPPPQSLGAASPIHLPPLHGGVPAVDLHNERAWLRSPPPKVPVHHHGHVPYHQPPPAGNPVTCLVLVDEDEEGDQAPRRARAQSRHQEQEEFTPDNDNVSDGEEEGDGDGGVVHPYGDDVASPVPVAPSINDSRLMREYSGGFLTTTDGEGEPETEVVDIDQLTAAEAVSLFRRSSTTAAKWTQILEEADVECVRDLRHMRSTAVWHTFLSQHSLLKSMLETLLDEPTKFLD